jgi:hypothetical protein
MQQMRLIFEMLGKYFVLWHSVQMNWVWSCGGLWSNAKWKWFKPRATRSAKRYAVSLSLLVQKQAATWYMDVAWGRRLVVGPSPRRPGFVSRPLHVEFVVDGILLTQVFPLGLRFFPNGDELFCRSLRLYSTGVYVTRLAEVVCKG